MRIDHAFLRRFPFSLLGEAAYAPWHWPAPLARVVW